MSRTAETVKPHPATAKAWAWFEEHYSEFSYDRRERIAMTLAALDAELWKLDHGSLVEGEE
jgi:hypothetical protein